MDTSPSAAAGPGGDIFQGEAVKPKVFISPQVLSPITNGVNSERLGTCRGDIPERFKNTGHPDAITQIRIPTLPLLPM